MNERATEFLCAQRIATFTRMGQIAGDRYRVDIGSQTVEIPLVPIAPGLAISLLMTIDHGVAFGEAAGADLAEAIADTRPEIVASAATLGIPVAIEVSRHLGLDDYLILQKTPKVHLADALSEPLSSITTDTPQRLLLDRHRIPAVAGKRVALVDDVIATGGSIAASARLLARRRRRRRRDRLATWSRAPGGEPPSAPTPTWCARSAPSPSSGDDGSGSWSEDWG